MIGVPIPDTKGQNTSESSRALKKPRQVHCRNLSRETPPPKTKVGPYVKGMVARPPCHTLPRLSEPWPHGSPTHADPDGVPYARAVSQPPTVLMSPRGEPSSYTHRGGHDRLRLAREHDSHLCSPSARCNMVKHRRGRQGPLKAEELPHSYRPFRKCNGKALREVGIYPGVTPGQNIIPFREEK